MVCSHIGCNKPVRARGLCIAHYEYLRRTPTIKAHINMLRRIHSGRKHPYQNDLPDEQWLPVKGFEALYHVSNMGRVRRMMALHGTYAGKLLKHQYNSGGYPRIFLSKDGETSIVFVHRLVAEAFIGARPDGMEINHKDMNRRNPLVTNLEYVSRSENIIHGNANRAYPPARGEDKPQHKLTWAIVDDIRRSSDTQRALAKKYEVCSRTISNIRLGLKWRRES